MLLLLTVVAFSSVASASPVAVGAFSWIVTNYDANGAPIEAQFNILNLTGPGGSLPPDFPVATQLLFDSLNIALDGGAAGGGSDIPQASMFPGVFAFSYDSPVLDLTVEWPMSAVLTGNVSPLLVSLDGGGQWQIGNGGAIFTGPLGQLGDGANPMDDLLLPEVIYVDAEQVPQAPEPAMLLLFGSAAAGLIAQRRRARKA